MVYYLAKNCYKLRASYHGKIKTAMLSMAFKMTKVRKISPLQLLPSPSYPGLHVQL